MPAGEAARAATRISRIQNTRASSSLSEPIGPSPGSRWAAYAWKAYGDDHLAKVIGNVKALTRAEIEAPKQIARGEYGIFIHPTQVGAADIWKLPKPHPFRLVVPEDGVMLLMGGMSLLKDAPHPNAARVFMNYVLTQVGAADHRRRPGRAVHPRDVTPQFRSWRTSPTAKPFPEQSRHLRIRLKAVLRMVGEGRALPEGGGLEEGRDGDTGRRWRARGAAFVHGGPARSASAGDVAAARPHRAGRAHHCLSARHGRCSAPSGVRRPGQPGTFTLANWRVRPRDADTFECS